MPLFYIEPEQLDILNKLQRELQSGSDKERNYGHRLWLIVTDIMHQKFPSVTPRRPLDDEYPNDYLESDRDFVLNNLESCTWILEALEDR